MFLLFTSQFLLLILARFFANAIVFYWSQVWDFVAIDWKEFAAESLISFLVHLFPYSVMHLLIYFLHDEDETLVAIAEFVMVPRQDLQHVLHIFVNFHN